MAPSADEPSAVECLNAMANGLVLNSFVADRLEIDADIHVQRS